MFWVLFFAVVMVSCTHSDLIRPGSKIGTMRVNRYGHTNADWIGNYCDMSSITDTPGVQTIECKVPKADELSIGSGICGVDEKQRDAIWQARTWEMYIDGNEVDLPAFNIADGPSDGLYCRNWRIRLRDIPQGEHTIRYIMHVNAEVEGEPDPNPLGTYELIVNFTQEK